MDFISAVAVDGIANTDIYNSQFVSESFIPLIVQGEVTDFLKLPHTFDGKLSVFFELSTCFITLISLV